MSFREQGPSGEDKNPKKGKLHQSMPESSGTPRIISARGFDPRPLLENERRINEVAARAKEYATDHEAQRELLDTVQLDQLDTFRKTGILDKVTHTIRSERGPKSLEYMGQPIASVVSMNDPKGPDIMQYTIAVERQTSDRSGSVLHVPVALELGDRRQPIGEFNQDDAEVVAGMINGLRELKKTGFLPYLNSDCRTLRNPNTEFTPA